MKEIKEVTESLKNGCECWKCHKKLSPGEYVYSAGVVFQDGIIEFDDGDLMALDEVIRDYENYVEKYRNDSRVKYIYISDEFCPYCLASLN